MVLTNIEKLLEKYENAETTLQEEAQLRAYFSGDNVAPHLEHYRSMFLYFSSTQQEQFTKDVPLKPKRSYVYQWISVAAVAVLMLSIFVPSSFLGGPTAQEQEEALIAYNKTMNALNMVSEGFNKGKTQNALSLMSTNFNQGVEGASRLSEFSKTTNKIFKNK
ncbi:MAG: hypothetical protein AAF901_05175 [Bacteroidota bacterium]